MPGATPDTPLKQGALKRIERRTLTVTVRGTAPLIVHRFDEKAKQTMLSAMQGKKKTKTSRDPEADYLRSLYRLPDNTYGFPCTAFKAATVDAARYFQGVRMTELRQALLFHGVGSDKLVRIMGEPKPREDIVRVGMSQTDLRYRAEFPEWSVALTITYIPSMVDADSVVTLVDAGGTGGVGEWRPGKAKTGSYGTYTLDDTIPINDCAEDPSA